MSATDDIRAWADSDRTQAEVIRWLVAIGTGDVSLSGAQADTLDATADGWTAIADAADEGVDDPDQH